MAARAIALALLALATVGRASATSDVLSALLAHPTAGRRLQSAGPLDCATCQLVAGIAAEVGNNATTLAELTQLIQDGICSAVQLPQPLVDLCDKLAAVPSDLIKFLVSNLDTVAWTPINWCATFVPVCTINCCNTDTAPEQRRLALTGNPSEMSITWATLNQTASVVQYGLAGGALTNSSTGTVRTYTFGGWLGWIHFAVMTGLQPGTSYSYRVGDPVAGWSDVAEFATLPANAGTPERPLRIVQTGDMGWGPNSNATAAALAALVDAGDVDLGVHIGDVSYSDGNEEGWGIFFRKMEPVYSRLPTLHVRGNHEATWQNGVEFYSQLGLSMPNPVNVSTGAPFSPANNRTYFSMALGPQVHLTLYDTESPIDTSDVDDVQAAWLAADLKAANAARAAGNGAAWLIVGAHRPNYCTNGGWNSSNKDCHIMADILREQIEDAFYSNKVDLSLAAHMHGMEASYPTYKAQPVSTSFANAPAPVYIVNGAAGNREGNDDPRADAPWSLPGSNTAAWGYGLITIAGSSTPGASSLKYVFVSSLNGTALVTLTLTK